MGEERAADLDARLLTHLVESAGMKSDIEHLRTNQNDLTNRVLVSLGELAGDVRAIRTDMSSVPERISACRADMRREIEKDFPNRVDAIEMEKRIEEQMRDTDRQLSRQITQVADNAKELHAALNTRIDGVENTLSKQWIKITTAITVVIVLLSLLAWALENISGDVLKGNSRESVRTGAWQNYQWHDTDTADTAGQKSGVWFYRRRV
jgi:hypothetical protein